jgi:hypothetical protein
MRVLMQGSVTAAYFSRFLLDDTKWWLLAHKGSFELQMRMSSKLLPLSFLA